jgi:hypothetical protein
MLVDAGFSVIVESGGEFTYLLTYFIQLWSVLTWLGISCF